ncbi:DUF488 domain-containing protein [Numidum massiliense]|uniref:DUF488 domain-containing protein n=1 Tax=Numidum massiliense TaxID=1522315 RepID=UPI0006D54313|nr:DUF488 family protein [Numidum massiliense]
MAHIQLKRVYTAAQREDGVRVLVDRLWPRGVVKGDGRVSCWLKEVAPTHELRRTFHRDHDFAAFARNYRTELSEREEAKEALRQLCALAKTVERVTLVFASKDEQHNNAVVLRNVLFKTCHL